MNSLKKFVKHIFYKVYQIEPYENKQELRVACDGRIIRSLSSSKKKVCATYLLNGLIDSKDT